MIIEGLHERHVYGRRIHVLATHLANLLPEGSRILDVGCGDGLLAARIMQAKPSVRISGLDVLVRPQTHIPVTGFDGLSIPFADGQFDAVMLVDVVHHAQEPETLLREAARVSCRQLVLKDHLIQGILGGPTLGFMDWVGNARHGVSLPYNYWPPATWQRVIASLGLTLSHWQERLGLYPWPASILFDRSLHFVARLDKP